MAVNLIPVGPGLPAEVAAILKSHEDAIRALQYPQEPQPAFPVESTDLPPAADYQNTVAFLTDLDVLAMSNGTDWIRADDGSAV